LNVDDLRSEENIKQLCQSNRSNSVIYSCQTDMISLPSSSMVQSNARSERRTPWKQRCNSKRALFMIMATSLIVSPFIIVTSIIFCLHRSNSIPLSKIWLDQYYFHKNVVSLICFGFKNIQTVIFYIRICIVEYFKLM